MIEVRGHCQEFLFVGKSLEKLFCIPTLFQYLFYSDWPNIHTTQSKKIGSLSPKGLITWSEGRSSAGHPSPTLPSGPGWGGVPWMKHLQSVRSVRILILTSPGTHVELGSLELWAHSTGRKELDYLCVFHLKMAAPGLTLGRLVGLGGGDVTQCFLQLLKHEELLPPQGPREEL